MRALASPGSALSWRICGGAIVTRGAGAAGLSATASRADFGLGGGGDFVSGSGAAAGLVTTTSRLGSAAGAGAGFVSVSGAAAMGVFTAASGVVSVISGGLAEGSGVSRCGPKYQYAPASSASAAPMPAAGRAHARGYP